MCVNVLKRLLYAAGIGLLGGIGQATYELAEESQHCSMTDSIPTEHVFIGVAPPPAAEPSRLDYREDVSPAILDFDWTGAPRKGASAWKVGGCGGPPVEIETPVDDLLDVLAIICGTDNPAESAALIHLGGCCALMVSSSGYELFPCKALGRAS